MKKMSNGKKEEDIVLDLSNKGIKFLTYFDGITVLNISNNHIQNLVNLPFNLRELTARNCQIKKIDFYPISLTTIDISFNKISTLQNIPMSCNILIAAHNLLERIDLPYFPSKIDLSHNQIHEVELTYPIHCVVNHLNLSHNEISILQDFECFKLVKGFDLSNNNLRKLDINFIPIIQGLYWSFKGNKISEIIVRNTVLDYFSSSNFEQFDSKSSILLNYNQITIATQIPWFGRFLYQHNPIVDIFLLDGLLFLHEPLFELYNTPISRCESSVNFQSIMSNIYFKRKYPSSYDNLYKKYVKSVKLIQKKIRHALYNPDNGIMMLKTKNHFEQLQQLSKTHNRLSTHDSNCQIS